MSAPFLVFPLCLLSMPIDWKDRMQHVISHAMQRTGNGDGAQAIGAEQIGKVVVDSKLEGYKPGSNHDAIIRGSKILGVSVGSLSATVKRCSTVDSFVADYERKHGKDALVFVASELFWGCHSEGNPTYREFSTLCAVNSILGFKSAPVLIRRSMIIARQLGYKSPAIMPQELKGLSNAPKALTTKELRGTLDSLEERKLIVRCRASPRMVYFSTKLTADELREAVLKRREARNLVQTRREIDWTTMAGTRRGPLKKEGPEEGHLKRKASKVVQNGPLKNEGPSEGHNGASKGPRTGPLKEMPSNKCLLINALKDPHKHAREQGILEGDKTDRTVFENMRAAPSVPEAEDVLPPMMPGEALSDYRKRTCPELG